jgi:glutathione S-transferase
MMRVGNTERCGMDVEPILYGAPYSVYVRAVRLTLAEKDVAYRLVPVDVFATAGVPPDHLDRHPFGRIPAFEYRGFRLYEAGAITRYVDEAFAGPSLQPGSPEDRARVNQVISILDSYVYRTLVWDIYVERVGAPKRNRAPDEARIEAALPRARVCLRALESIMGEGPFLTGAALTLADLHAAPMFACFTQASEAQVLLEAHDLLRSWWDMMAGRTSMAATVPA